ncbi:MAG: hypothetical protein AMQ22_00032 [Candidatus Methanofastidiosum methylothiophilum]|uniref:Uncharacterized protein n=1 Tax=Candidatus Methanofastidiosum methylothiophilum TaxID=1705564 RepID=A0A150J989_9EURY|nr:MAG: hypothetical protein AMQ22_00032 [Candidatus Methanofastidiosum methylthiophilus]
MNGKCKVCGRKLKPWNTRLKSKVYGGVNDVEESFKNECICGAVYEIDGDGYRFLGVKELGRLVKPEGE